MTDISQMVRVTWRDAHDGPAGWHTAGDLEAGWYTVQTVGWLIGAAKPGHITVCGSHTCAGFIAETVHIPLVNVTRIEALIACTVLPVEPES